MLVACQVLFIVQHLGWRFGERRELVGSQFDHLARALQPCLVRGRHAGPEARAADRADLTVELGTRDHAADDVLACWQEVCHRSDGESSAQLAIAVPLSQVASTALLPQTDLLRRMVGPGDPSGDFLSYSRKFPTASKRSNRRLSNRPPIQGTVLCMCMHCAAGALRRARDVDSRVGNVDSCRARLRHWHRRAAALRARTGTHGAPAPAPAPRRPCPSATGGPPTGTATV